MVVSHADEASGTRKHTQTEDNLQRYLSSSSHLQALKHEEWRDGARPVHQGQDDCTHVADENPAVRNAAMTS